MSDDRDPIWTLENQIQAQNWRDEWLLRDAEQATANADRFSDEAQALRDKVTELEKEINFLNCQMSAIKSQRDESWKAVADMRQDVAINKAHHASMSKLYLGALDQVADLNKRIHRLLHPQPAEAGK